VLCVGCDEVEIVCWVVLIGCDVDELCENGFVGMVVEVVDKVVCFV